MRVYVIDADPVDGPGACERRSHWDVYGGADRGELGLPRRARWDHRVLAWETREARAKCLHLRWLVDHARPWAGVSPLQHARDTGSLAGWIERRL